MNLSIGSTAHRILAAHDEGTVIAVFSKAVYLEFDDDVLALVVPEVAAGPLHMNVAHLPRVSVGMPVFSGDRSLRIGATSVLVPTEVWRAPALRMVTTALGVLRRIVTHRPVLDITAAEGVDVTLSLDHFLAQGDIAGACTSLFGRGGGLTPAGDDVAAGVLLISALNDPSRSAELRTIADAAPTHAISRAFLRAAAEGECIEPVYSLLRACTDNDLDGASLCLQRLREVGHTSGLDLVAGVLAALAGLSVREARLSRETSSIHVHSTP